MLSYENLSIDELGKKLAEQEDLFEEVLEERDIVVAQHNIHLPGCTLGKYQAELDRIQKKINTLKQLIEKYESSEN